MRKYFKAYREFPTRLRFENMLQAAFSDISSVPLGATRKVYWTYSDRVATKRNVKIAKTLRDTVNFSCRCVASGSEYLLIHLYPRSLRQTKLTGIAAEDILKTKSNIIFIPISKQSTMTKMGIIC